MEIFILYKFYISFIFKTYFKKKKKAVPQTGTAKHTCEGKACAALVRAQTPVRGQPPASAPASQGTLHFQNSVCKEKPALSTSTPTQRRSVQKSASFIDYQMICASVSTPARAHRAAARRLSCVFNLDASTVAYCCSINTPSSGIMGNTAGTSLPEPLTVTAFSK